MYSNIYGVNYFSAQDISYLALFAGTASLSFMITVTIIASRNDEIKECSVYISYVSNWGGHPACSNIKILAKADRQVSRILK